MSLVDALIDSKSETLKFYDLNSDDLLQSYEPGKWSIREILVHLADAESVLHERIKRVIAEPRQVIWAFDQDLWWQNLDYAHFPLEISKSLFMANRDSVIYLAERHYDGSEKREFIHSQTGLRTLKDEFDKVLWHNQNHLVQIRRALSIKTVC
ncbi:DinB family protein [Salmonirosea aquatica]|uniref:Metal-dependent hydrolase n=1 Tax=Salmonirosea aquatica TaxID=2654236 RepID=A0A7C9BCH9_9BACT|nr:metal-dependent hydrolase [Cytophagaceae bacterium SJW1-29]